MGRKRTISFLFAVLIAAGGLAACSRKANDGGPAQRAGRAMDRGLEKAGEGVERAGEKMKEAAN